MASYSTTRSLLLQGYACKTSEHAPVTAALPPQPLPKSNASPGLLAMLLTTKYVDGLGLLPKVGRLTNKGEGVWAVLEQQSFFFHATTSCRLCEPAAQTN